MYHGEQRISVDSLSYEKNELNVYLDGRQLIKAQTKEEVKVKESCLLHKEWELHTWPNCTPNTTCILWACVPCDATAAQISSRYKFSTVCVKRSLHCGPCLTTFRSGACAVQSTFAEQRDVVGVPGRHCWGSAEIAKGRVETRNRLKVGRCLIVGITRVMRGRLRMHRQLPAPAGAGGLADAIHRDNELI